MPRRKPSFCSHIRFARTTERVLQMDVCSQAGRTIADVCWKQRRSDCLRQPNCLKQSLIASGSSASPICALLAAPPNGQFPNKLHSPYHLESPNLARFERGLHTPTCPGRLHRSALEAVDGKKMSAVGVGRRGVRDFSSGIHESYVTLACNTSTYTCNDGPGH